MNIKKLNLKTRTKILLEKNGFTDTSKIIKLTEVDLLSEIKNFGRISLMELKDALKEKGFSLRTQVCIRTFIGQNLITKKEIDRIVKNNNKVTEIRNHMNQLLWHHRKGYWNDRIER